MSRWNPPEDMARIARDRCRDILKQWSATIAWGESTIAILAESCYMQGIKDSVESLHQRGLVISSKTNWDSSTGVLLP